VASMSSRPAALEPETLRPRFRGRVIGPADPGYDEARTIALGGIDRRPAVIVRVADTDDVLAGIALARETGLELAVRAGGHSGAAHGVVDGGIVLDLRDLSSLEIDVDGRTAWAGGGLTAGAYTVAVGQHGLATGFGDTGSVGIGGITLGGGVGYLVRKHGLTIDSLLAAEVVTADGQVIMADEDHHPDLFWAIRGGGGNMGVITRFRYRLHPVDTVVGGMLFLPATPEAIAGFIAASEAAPEDLSAIANVMPCPPMPFVPAEHHGTTVIFALMCFAGPAEEAEAAYAPFRALGTPLADLIRPTRYPELFPPDQEGYHPLAVTRTLYLDGFDVEDGRLILERIAASDAAMRVVQLRVLGGAAARVSEGATAYAHRTRRIMGNVASFYEGPDDRERRLAWVEALRRDLHPADGAYVNFLADEGVERVREAYPGATWERLAEVKRRYDPGNLFHLNQNVPPATG